MRDLTVAVWQFASTPGDIEGNLGRLAEAAGRAADRGADLIVAPEMALTGWHPESRELAVETDGELVGRVGGLAREQGIAIATSLLTVDGKALRNTFMLWDADGRVLGRQHKVHLWADEARTVTPGELVEPIKTRWGLVGGVLCYDVEFPEVSRSLALSGAEILLVPSAFFSPTGWDVSTRARALENGCWLAAANQVGGPPERPHNGMSRLVDPFGEVLEALDATSEGMLVGRFAADRVRAARDYAPFLRDLRLGPARRLDA